MPPIRFAPPTSLIGKWVNSHTLFYSAALTLRADGTFTYHAQGCTGQWFSRGYWLYHNDVISLTSLAAFKQKANEPQVAFNVVALPAPKRTKKARYRGHWELPELSGPSDTTNVYFENTELRLSADTLVCTHSTYLSVGSKYHPYKARQ